MTWDPVQDIEDFHKKFEQAYEGGPRVLPKDIQEFRSKFMREELDEYEAAVDDLSEVGENTADMALAFDALIDLVYVALGTAHLHGFDFREGWRRVHAANMSKVLAKSADESKRGYALDVVKPVGWLPPDHSDLVRKLPRVTEE